MARIVYMGTPDFAAVILDALVAAGAPVVAVVTQPDRPAGRHNQLRPPAVKVRAEAHGLPVHQPKRVREGRLAGLVAGYAPDLVIVAAYGRILPPDALAVAPLGCVNVHGSLLPRWRGAAPIQRALLAGDATTGVCLMRMEEGLDTGPVYACRATPIRPDDTAETLHDRLAELGAALLVEELPALLEGRLVPNPQDERRSTLAPPLLKEEGALRFGATVREVCDQVRGVHPWPGAYTYCEGRRLKVFPPVVPAEGPRGVAGEVVAVAPDALVVACKDGAVRLVDVQEENRKRMPVRAFLSGHPVRPGTRLGE